jgi:hypothetical protein
MLFLAMVGGMVMAFVTLGFSFHAATNAAQGAVLEFGEFVFGELVRAWVPEGGPGAFVALFMLTMWLISTSLLLGLMLVVRFIRGRRSRQHA